MDIDKIIRNTEVGMIRGKRFNFGEIRKYEGAIRQTVHDEFVEVAMLYFAEAMHDEAGYGAKRTARILRCVDNHMKEWYETPDFSLMDLRVRVFKKTGFMFVCHPEEEEALLEALKADGCDVKSFTEGEE